MAFTYVRQNIFVAFKYVRHISLGFCVDGYSLKFTRNGEKAVFFAYPVKFSVSFTILCSTSG